MSQPIQVLHRTPGSRPRVVILGGGFGGLHAAKALGKLPDQERQQWGKLWEEVAALLKKVEGK